jgi:hypothetical protein
VSWFKGAEAGPELPAPPQPRTPVVAGMAFLGCTQTVMDMLIERHGLVVVPAGAFSQPGLADTDWQMLAEQQAEARAAEARTFAEKQATDQHVLSQGGVVQVIDRPGDERDAVLAYAAKMDKLRQEAGQHELRRSYG